MILIGVDVGTANCGLAMLVASQGGFALRQSQTVRTKATEAEGARLQTILEALRDYLDAAQVSDRKSTYVAIEGYSHGAKFGLAEMGEIGGVVRHYLHMRQVAYHVWPPASWKKLVIGNGKADKSVIRLEMWRRYTIDLANQNELDACGVALAEWMAQTGAPRPRPKKPKAKAETQA